MLVVDMHARSILRVHVMLMCETMNAKLFVVVVCVVAIGCYGLGMRDINWCCV